ncbi:MAG: V-type ATP synthase subunit D [Firmicutes bacterium]|nr:V-type ATP synthase subunit D [Bacillota bacterium]
MKLNVNPTRMELARIKKLHKTATRGHKLLKDKLDELMKQFMNIVRENKELREHAEASLENAYNDFVIAGAVMSEEYLGEALMMPVQSVSLEVSEKNIMSVNVPVFTFIKDSGNKAEYPYGFAFTSGELDGASKSFLEAMDPLLRLAESEKKAQLLAQEIEKTRRRVNALENVLIPNYEETMRYIRMKLDEDERGATTRLMKVKDMIYKKAIEAKKAQEAAAETAFAANA